MKRFIDREILPDVCFGLPIDHCRYDLVDEKDVIVLPQFWESMIKPGCALKMFVRPVPAPLGVQVIRPPQFGLPRPPPGWPAPRGPANGPEQGQAWNPPRRYGPFPVQVVHDGPRNMGQIKNGGKAGGIAEKAEIIHVIETGRPAGHSGKGKRRKPASNARARPPGGYHKRCNKNSDNSDSSSSDGSDDSDDSSELVSDSEIDDEVEDLGIEIDFDKEEEKAELSLSDLLGKWTNATDIVENILDFESDESDSGSSVMS
jgi:hypothetical protein